MKEITIIKKDSTIELFNPNKIRLAVEKSASRTLNGITDDEMNNVVTFVYNNLSNSDRSSFDVDFIHELVQMALSQNNHDVYMSYKSYRDYKINYVKSFQKAAEFSHKVVHVGDKENANKDSSLNSTKQSLIGEAYMKELVRNFEMKKEWIKAHDDGFIHIHDLGSRYLDQINCCLFDMESVLSGGFEMNGVRYTEPTNIRSAWNVVGDVTLNASSQQYGGFTIPSIDKTLAKYAKKTYDKKYAQLLRYNLSSIKAHDIAVFETIDEIKQGYQGFEHKLNTVSNALGQTPFVTISFGMETTPWGRRISEAILEEREKGMGKDKVTAVFPKLVFMYRTEINGDSDSPNYDLFLKSVQCSRTRLYPDYLSYDNPDDNLLAQIYEDTSETLVSMGCRAFLSRANNPTTNEEVIDGRNNIGAVSLNIPKLAFESIADAIDEDDAFDNLYNNINNYAQYVWDIHLQTYEKIGRMKGSTNPLMFVEGGAWMSVGHNDPIKPIIDLSTASLGYVGLDEASNLFHNLYGSNKEEVKIKIIKFLRFITDEAKEHYGKLFALYATPAENLVTRFQKINKDDYGAIEGFTDRDYMTNSFHIHVAEDINAIDKITTESPYHQISSGGRITYTEFPYAVDQNVLIDSIKYAMSKGLYYGVNVVSSSCESCKHKGDFTTCPKCNSDKVTVVVRVCGYLTFLQTKGDTRLNSGKVSETAERVKHKYL